MALYEGIALIQEKQAVVLDLGTDYTKFGFTGEAAPRCIIPSQYWCASERRHKRVYDYRTAEELYDNLVHMLHTLYFRHVLVNPKERKVVVVESLFTPTLFRETLAKVLFLHYEVSGVMWADSARLSALTLGAPVALVVSLGAEEAEVVAVVHGCPVLHAMQSAPLGARAVHAQLADTLDADNGQSLELPAHVLEDITVRACFVPSRARALALAADRAAPPARGTVYTLAERTVAVSGAARELSAEPLFARDNEMASLPDIILQCIMKSPIDARRALAENILVCGGGACLPGLRARLAQELRHLVTEHPYSERICVSEFKFHTAPAPLNAVAWAGGALGGAADGGARALPRDAYLRAPRLRDWPCLLHTTPPHHHHWRDARDA
ncbi:actin-related protein 10 isoform X1 [Maniola hyperantus]|uniref:actin-related protein 10 isoform X1 n=1 Tax=Aphantopus hyperantus TaxID=2795564 RepID=UPI0015684A81|nr:actin-related protein 10 [Maniola hyperantus]